MKTSLSIPFIVLIACMLTSCTNYQYLTLSGDSKIDDSARFIQSLDSLEIMYGFLPNSMIEIQLYNQKNQMMYVDWEKSSFIYNSESIPLISSEEYFSGSSYSFANYYGADFDGTIHKSHMRRYLPPNTHIVQQFPLDFVQFLNGEELTTVDHIKDSYGNLYQYTENNSPLKFETYIYLNDQTEKNPIILQHSFWIKEVYNTTDGNRTSYANQMVLHRTNKGGAVFGTIALVGATVYLVATLAPEEETNTNLLGQ